MNDKSIDGNDPALEAQLDQLLAKASTVDQQGISTREDLALKNRILAAVPLAAKTATQDNWLDGLWQWFSQPLRLAATAALPLMLGFALGNANLITDDELLVTLSEQDSWALEQMLDESTWSESNE